MKYKQKVETLTSLVLILIGTILLLCPLYKITDIKWINLIIFLSYAIINLLKFILTYKSKDYEGLFTCLASIVAAITSIVLKSEKSAINLSLTLMIWIILLSLIKLKKADYYHDRRDRMWKLNILMLGIFILCGLLTSINLYYEADVQVIVIGFFFMINGILEMFDPIVKTLITHA